MTDRLIHEQTNKKLGTVVRHRRYLDYSHAHYAGKLVDGGYVPGLFSDIATDLCLYSTVTRGCSPRTPRSPSTNR